MECGDYQSLSNPDILKLDENYIQATKEKVAVLFGYIKFLD